VTSTRGGSFCSAKCAVARLYGVMQIRRARKSLDLIHRSLSDFAIHLTARIIGEAESILSRTRAALAPAKPVLRILDRIDPLAKLAAMR
jgi:hypothetical protein